MEQLTHPLSGRPMTRLPDGGFAEEPPEHPMVFRFETSGSEQGGVTAREHDIWAADLPEARRIVRSIEEQFAKHFGTELWEIEEVLP